MVEGGHKSTPEEVSRVAIAICQVVQQAAGAEGSG